MGRTYHLRHNGEYVRASTTAIDLIKRFEQYRHAAYQDSGGVWTVGYGTTGPGINERTTVSEPVARGMLIGDVSRIGQDITPLVGSVNQFQFDALVSLVYNIGLTAFKDSTLLKLVQDKKLELAAGEFPKWNHVDGKVEPGLTSRREAERALFLTSL